MAEQNRQYEDDYRNGRRLELGRGEEQWRSSRDNERDEQYGYGSDRERWSMSDREGSYGRSSGRQEFGGQDRDQFAGGGRYNQGRQSSAWRDESRDTGSRGSLSYGSGYGSGRDREQWGNQYGSRGEGGYGSSGRYGSGSTYESGRGSSSGWGAQDERGFGNQGFSGNQDDQRHQNYGQGGYQSYGGGQRHGWGQGQSYGGNETFGRGGENFGRGGEVPGSMGRQSYAGKGPKNYKRSDERIQEEVCDRLTEDATIDASEIVVAVKDGEVTLSGTVSTREEKRRAEDIVERSSGVKEVTNNIRLQRQGEQESGKETGGRHQTGTGSASSSQQSSSTGGSAKNRQTTSGE